ncbi:MAG: hypothetical protein VYD54_13195 [Bdellovibrionota bacterium]|nr:hypothetical protein [Bdellovibrionota bacterium]
MECQMDFTKKSDLSFLGNHCRSISLKRLKRHSFIDSITHSDLTRSISPDHEQHWLSVIFVKSKGLRFIFKTSYLTKDVREFASNAYGANFGQENLNKRMMDEFVKEFCNLMGGGIKEHFEKNGLTSEMSLPLLTRGQDGIFFRPSNPELYEELLSESWELKLGRSSLVCEAFFEIYSRESLVKICNEVPLMEAGGEIELF